MRQRDRLRAEHDLLNNHDRELGEYLESIQFKHDVYDGPDRMFMVPHSVVTEESYGLYEDLEANEREVYGN